MKPLCGTLITAAVLVLMTVSGCSRREPKPTFPTNRQVLVYYAMDLLHLESPIVRPGVLDLDAIRTKACGHGLGLTIVGEPLDMQFKAPITPIENVRRSEVTLGFLFEPDLKEVTVDASAFFSGKESITSGQLKVREGEVLCLYLPTRDKPRLVFVAAVKSLKAS